MYRKTFISIKKIEKMSFYLCQGGLNSKTAKAYMPSTSNAWGESRASKRSPFYAGLVHPRTRGDAVSIKSNSNL